MKFTKLILFTAVSLSVFSCKEEPTEPTVTDPTYGILKVNVIGKHGTDDFIMYTEATTADDISYRVEGLKFYVSNTKLDAKTSSDVFLLNFVNNHLQAGSTGESFEVEFETGTYSNLSFLVGLDNETNHEDPSLYASTHPLSSFNDTHWDWSQGYKFFMTDGKIDSDSNDVPDQSYSYHIGNDDYVKEISLAADVVISDGATTVVNILFDVKQIINTVDVNAESFTHSTSNFPLVEKIANNYSAAFQIQ